MKPRTPDPSARSATRVDSPRPADPSRRRWLAGSAALLLAPPVLAQDDERVAALLREGGCVIAFRHALAPGTFDPPQFRLGDCSTQRNLNDEGRAQAGRIGQWFKTRQLTPARVRSSPWCRCVDTATIAFGRAEAWPALGSPRGYTEQAGEDHLKQLRSALAELSRRKPGFEVWSTHMFVLSDLAQTGTRSGEGLVLRPATSGGVQVLARLAID